MNCRRVEPLLSDHLEDRLTAREAAAVARHLKHCPACRRRQETFRALGAELRGLAELQPPPAMASRAMARWAAEQASQPIADSRQATVRRGRRRLSLSPVICHLSPAVCRLSPALALALGTMIAAAGLALVHHRQGGQGAPAPRIAIGPPASATGPQAGPRDMGPVLPADSHRRRGGDLLPLPRLEGPGPRALPRHVINVRPGTHGPSGAPLPLPVPPGPQVASRGDDLKYLNPGPDELPRWVPMPADEWAKIEQKVRENTEVVDDFVQIPFPRLAAASDRQVVAAVESYKREAAIVDARLVREVSLAVKATALVDLCEQLRSETGIHLRAGASVADEKVTVFCQKQPLRDVMRQLSRPFGYTWLRSGKPNDYRYELAQDLRSQLLEEELRSRDRNAALLALDEELGRYRQYLDLSPDEALARARNATGEEKKRLERYASWAWGPLQIYARLTPADLAALRAGERINFSGRPQEGERALPADLEQGVLQSMRDRRLVKTENGFRPAREADALNSVSPAQVPEARGRISIEIDRDDLGKMVYDVNSGITGIYPDGRSSMDGGYLAVGESPSVRSPENAAANRALARDPALAPRITVAPRPAYRPAPDAQPADGGPPTARGYTSALPAQPMVTTAEVLEAIHQATGLPIVADYYTRLYPAASLSVQNVRVFDALNSLGDTMRLRWRKEAGTRGAGGWIQFRSASYFHDRVKEVPNRLLQRWAASRKQHGFLPLDDLCEIASLPAAQLDAEEMAEGARVLYGLMEWALFPRRGGLRPYLRHLAAFTPAQRRQMQTPPGLHFSQMSLAQQQRFLTLALGRDGNGMARLEHLAGAAMRVDYAVPGTYEWHPRLDEWRLSPGPTSPFTAEALLPRVRERTREAALLAARRIDPQVSAAQIRPTEPALTILYLPGPGSPLSAGGIHVARSSEKRTMAIRAPDRSAGQ